MKNKTNFSIQNHGFALFYCRFLMMLMSKFTKRYVYNGLASKITNFTNFTSFTNFTNFWKLFWRIHAELQISWSARELTWGAQLMNYCLEFLSWALELLTRIHAEVQTGWSAHELTSGVQFSSWAQLSSSAREILWAAQLISCCPDLLTWAHELTSWSGAPHGSARRVFKNW